MLNHIPHKICGSQRSGGIVNGDKIGIRVNEFQSIGYGAISGHASWGKNDMVFREELCGGAGEIVDHRLWYSHNHLVAGADKVSDGVYKNRDAVNFSEQLILPAESGSCSSSDNDYRDKHTNNPFILNKKTPENNPGFYFNYALLIGAGWQNDGFAGFQHAVLVQVGVESQHVVEVPAIELAV